MDSFWCKNKNGEKYLVATLKYRLPLFIIKKRISSKRTAKIHFNRRILDFFNYASFYPLLINLHHSGVSNMNILKKYINMSKKKNRSTIFFH